VSLSVTSQPLGGIRSSSKIEFEGHLHDPGGLRGCDPRECARGAYAVSWPVVVGIVPKVERFITEQQALALTKIEVLEEAEILRFAPVRIQVVHSPVPECVESGFGEA